MPPDETSQPTSSENPVPQEPTPVQENIPEALPTEPILPEEIKSEPTPTQEIPQPEPTPQITTEPTNPNITIEKTPDTVTVTEVMSPPVPEVSKMPFDTKTFLKSLLPKLKEKLSFRTEKRLAKIIELASKKGEIKNDDVEKLLHVSDASASRYLAKLVQRGNLKISGPKNHAKYIPN